MESYSEGGPDSKVSSSPDLSRQLRRSLAMPILMRLENNRTAPENTPNMTASTWNSKPPEFGSMYIVFSILIQY
jgi:hypothetical protein